MFLGDATISASSAQVCLQAKLRQLHVGRTSLAEVRAFFGEPDAVEDKTAWVKNKSAPKKHVNHYLANTQKARNLKDEPLRTLRVYSYRALGLKLLLFDNPSTLYSFEITNRRLWSNGIRVGNSLMTVLKPLGTNGDWLTTSARNDCSLEYERLGVRFTFPRSPKWTQFPTKLEKKRLAVTSIEVFDSRVVFGR